MPVSLLGPARPRIIPGAFGQGSPCRGDTGVDPAAGVGARRKGSLGGVGEAGVVVREKGTPPGGRPRGRCAVGSTARRAPELRAALGAARRDRGSGTAICNTDVRLCQRLLCRRISQLEERKAVCDSVSL